MGTWSWGKHHTWRLSGEHKSSKWGLADRLSATERKKTVCVKTAPIGPLGTVPFGAVAVWVRMETIPVPKSQEAHGQQHGIGKCEQGAGGHSRAGWLLQCAQCAQLSSPLQLRCLIPTTQSFLPSSITKAKTKLLGIDKKNPTKTLTAQETSKRLLYDILKHLDINGIHAAPVPAFYECSIDCQNVVNARKCLEKTRF